MVSKKMERADLQRMKKQVEELYRSTNRIKSDAAKEIESKADPTSSNLLTLLKYMVGENQKTTMLLKGMMETLERVEFNLASGYEDEEVEQVKTAPITEPQIQPKKMFTLSPPDAKIVQYIQTRHNEIACADEIKAFMGYKGRNAASSRLNRLHDRGLLIRFQIGHKVYYKFDAGKAANTLIVSPPQ